jgi:hypothetical protein
MFLETLLLLADVVVAGLGIVAVGAIIFGAVGALAAVGFIRATLRSRGVFNAISGCLAGVGLVVALILLWWGVFFWWQLIVR